MFNVYKWCFWTRNKISVQIIHKNSRSCNLNVKIEFGELILHLLFNMIEIWLHDNLNYYLGIRPYFYGFKYEPVPRRLRWSFSGHGYSSYLGPQLQHRMSAKPSDATNWKELMIWRWFISNETSCVQIIKYKSKSALKGNEKTFYKFTIWYSIYWFTVSL